MSKKELHELKVLFMNFYLLADAPRQKDHVHCDYCGDFPGHEEDCPYYVARERLLELIFGIIVT